MRKQEQKSKITALYERLSHDDGRSDESVSVENQKRILEDYARKNTDLVVRPWVASMAIPFSFAFCTRRFIGADSGLTIAMILDVFTIFPNPIWISIGYLASQQFSAHSQPELLSWLNRYSIF